MIKHLIIKHERITQEQAGSTGDLKRITQET